ncbi:MAG: class I SAM-dependent methyltransferase, partial [Actinomycetota bacterium]
VYEATLAGLRGTPIRMLEIGVFEGGSLAAWRRYLGPQAVLVGLDIDPACAAYGDPERGTYVRIGAQQDAMFLRSVIDELGPFDVIVDDGSHMASHLVASFRILFAHGLADGGIYLAEDLQTSYWRHYRDARPSFLEVAKGLVDLLHGQYHDDAALEPDFRAGTQAADRPLAVPLITRLIDSIEFHDGLVVIRRAKGLRQRAVSVRSEHPNS